MQAQQFVHVCVLLVQFQCDSHVDKCSCASCFAPVVVVCGCPAPSLPLVSAWVRCKYMGSFSLGVRCKHMGELHRLSQVGLQARWVTLHVGTPFPVSAGKRFSILHVVCVQLLQLAQQQCSRLFVIFQGQQLSAFCVDFCLWSSPVSYRVRHEACVVLG
jgi:hypothetical protein